VLQQQHNLTQLGATAGVAALCTSQLPINQHGCCSAPGVALPCCGFLYDTAVQQRTTQTNYQPQRSKVAEADLVPSVFLQRRVATLHIFILTRLVTSGSSHHLGWYRACNPWLEIFTFLQALPAAYTPLHVCTAGPHHRHHHHPALREYISLKGLLELYAVNGCSKLQRLHQVRRRGHVHALAQALQGTKC
jgi:hypothetical protein